MKRRVLIVDDNRDAADSLAAVVRTSSHEVRVAYDGWSAIEKARELRPEVVFLDIGMPGLDGYEVARRLRVEPGLRHILIVAVTGYDVWPQAQAAGFNDLLKKPPDLVRVEALLQI